MGDVLRESRAGDAMPIAALHLAVRRATYAGQLPAAVLDADTLEHRAAMWKNRLADPAKRVYVVEQGGVLLGLACGGPMPERPNGREPLPGFDAYLDSLYVDPVAHGRGLGRKLLRRVAARLAADGFTSLALHTLSANPARGFYERLGARFLRYERVEAAGHAWVAVAYGWPTIAVAAGLRSAGSS